MSSESRAVYRLVVNVGKKHVRQFRSCRKIPNPNCSEYAEKNYFGSCPSTSFKLMINRSFCDFSPTERKRVNSLLKANSTPKKINERQFFLLFPSDLTAHRLAGTRAHVTTRKSVQYLTPVNDFRVFFTSTTIWLCRRCFD